MKIKKWNKICVQIGNILKTSDAFLKNIQLKLMFQALDYFMDFIVLKHFVPSPLIEKI